MKKSLVVACVNDDLHYFLSFRLCSFKMISCVKGLESADMQRSFVFVYTDFRAIESANYQDGDLIQSHLRQEDL